MTKQAAKNFNEDATRASAEDVSLAGYMDFAFGEGQLDNPSRYAGNLFHRKAQAVFARGTSAEWKADCLVYTGHFDLGKKLPSEEVQTQALVKIFEAQGVTVLKTSVEEQVDAEELGHKIRAVSIRAPLADIAKVRKAIVSIDAQCNGHLIKRLKAQAPSPAAKAGGLYQR